MSWVFPGRTIQIDASCLHSGEPMRVAVRDGVLERTEPAEMVCYVDLPFREWARSWPDT